MCMNKENAQKQNRRKRSDGGEQAMKGYLYTVEVLIAISLVMITFVLVFQSVPTKPNLETSLVKQQGYDALKYLDNRGLLRFYVHEDSEADIESQLSQVLVSSIKFEAQVCDYWCNSTNIPASDTVVAVDYYVSGYMDYYSGKKVRLWMWTE